MNPLTDSAERTLRAAAYLTGEPGAPFTLDALSDFMARGHGDYVPAEERGARGLASHSLPSLERRGYSRIVSRVPPTYALTDAGFNYVVRLTGGRGLL